MVTCEKKLVYIYIYSFLMKVYIKTLQYIKSITVTRITIEKNAYEKKNIYIQHYNKNNLGGKCALMMKIISSNI